MREKDTGRKALLSLDKAAAYLNLTEPGIQALIDAGYLSPDGVADGGPEFNRVSLKAFLARNADNGAGNVFELEPESVDPQSLIDALDGRADEMARRAYEIFAGAFPEARAWSLSERASFIEQASARFEAILAVTGQGAEADETLVVDLQDVGAAAAWAGSPLPQLLVMLRISRDLVVQSAVELAEEGGRHWGLALSLLLTRVLPAMDRLTDALAKGYWGAVLGRDAEAKTRYQDLVESSFSGICEIDLEGYLRYANPALATILGRQPEEMDGSALSDIMTPVDLSLSDVLAWNQQFSNEVHRFSVVRTDGVRRVVDVRTHPRYQGDSVVGYQMVFQDVTIAADLEADKNEFLAMVTHGLRQPLSTIVGLGATLESQAQELDGGQVTRMGAAIRGQAERMSRLADDLYDVSRLEAAQLFVAPRPVDLAQVINDAMASVASTGQSGFPDVEIRVAPGLLVQADPRRLEQIMANLIDNALEHGQAPVVVELRRYDPDGSAELAVRDGGRGVDPVMIPTLFNRTRTLARHHQGLARRAGLGLALVRGLIEAMGGRVWYEGPDAGGPAFCVRLPTSRRRLPG